MTTNPTTNPQELDDLLLSALTHTDPVVRMTARLTSTDAFRIIDQWVMEEVDRGSDLADVVAVLAHALFSKVAYTAASPLQLLQSQHDRATYTNHLQKRLQEVFSHVVPAAITAAASGENP